MENVEIKPDGTVRITKTVPETVTTVFQGTPEDLAQKIERAQNQVDFERRQVQEHEDAVQKWQKEFDYYTGLQTKVIEKISNPANADAIAIIPE